MKRLIPFILVFLLVFLCGTGFLMLKKAGFGTRRALERIMTEAQQETGAGRKKKDALCSELQYALSKMQKGVSEEQAYQDFGSRCRLPCYRRFGSYLSRNLRQGLFGGEEYAVPVLKAIDEFMEMPV